MSWCLLSRIDGVGVVPDLSVTPMLAQDISRILIAINVVDLDKAHPGSVVDSQRKASDKNHTGLCALGFVLIHKIIHSYCI